VIMMAKVMVVDDTADFVDSIGRVYAAVDNKRSLLWLHYW